MTVRITKPTINVREKLTELDRDNIESKNIHNLDVTKSLSVPKGTTAERPIDKKADIRYNTTTTSLEFYNGTEWVDIVTDYVPTGSTTLG